MRVLFLTSGPFTPATRYRVMQYLPSLRVQGVECVVAHSHPAKYEAYRWLGWRLSEQVRFWSRRLDVLRARHGRFDAIVVEREVFTGPETSIEEALRQHTGRLILDVDDGIFLDQSEKFARLANLADTVVCGSRLIAEHFVPLSHDVVTIPTVIDTALFPAKEEFGEHCVLGWTGTSSNLPYLLRLKSVLAQLAREQELRLDVIADRSDGLDELTAEGVDVRFHRWDPLTEARLLSTFDVGLMPLPDESWARYKCGLKIIQYMGLGIPAVASPVGANADIISDGKNGCLAATDEDWVRVLGSLRNNTALRQRLGRAGRRTAEERYSVASQVDRWVDVLRGQAGSQRGLEE